MAWFEKVSELFKGYGIPDYVWIPIMMCESVGNPNARSSEQRVDEVSKGLFQINIKANPQYANLDLYDPLINAEIAAKDFIQPAYKKALTLGLTNPLDITEYVWHYGIRPYWDSAHQQIIRQETQKVLKGEIVVPNTDNKADQDNSSSRPRKLTDTLKKLRQINKLIKRIQK